ncbi:MAG TPA: GNAT family N-acetyltransferase [Pyrinomonadaceae bacterium]|jgi:GNAT superfamily N-acetyltransferase
MKIKIADSAEDIDRCYPVIKQLRPHLSGNDFLAQVRRQQKENYSIIFLEDEGKIKSVAGFRIIEMLYCGLSLYVDDLITVEMERSKGYGEALFDWMVDYAKRHGCRELHLDTGIQRFNTHRFYFRKRMKITLYHFSLPLAEEVNSSKNI